MSFRKELIGFIFLIVFSVNPSFSQEFITENGSVTFLSKASLNEFEGKSQQLQGLVDLNKNLLDFYIDLNTLKTGIGLRDRHMRENYLETQKFPYAEFTGKIAEGPELKSGESRKVTAKGKFKIHGVEREIDVPGTIKRLNDNTLELEAEFKVLLGDYKIDIPKVMFYELSEEQTVTIKTQLKKK
ncbi:YceI family protein [Mongoliibacter ruber]|uniref:YceI-like domain-containing protein n=1 Tax=Mongoliibacter ruber TaxID=1750599 RepID=A0A2T0WUH7_9BACT|nr:YceI family protein [Mongoliibacter ruber]PRY90348.1 YceI-like domain-containing protein [Mongoliibacter ruber]